MGSEIASNFRSKNGGRNLDNEAAKEQGGVVPEIPDP